MYTKIKLYEWETRVYWYNWEGVKQYNEDQN